MIALPLVAASCGGKKQKDQKNPGMEADQKKFNAATFAYEGTFTNKMTFSLDKIKANNAEGFTLNKEQSEIKFKDNIIFAKLTFTKDENMFSAYIKFAANSKDASGEKITKEAYEAIQEDHQGQKDKKDQDDKKDQQGQKDKEKQQDKKDQQGQEDKKDQDDKKALEKKEFEKNAKFAYSKTISGNEKFDSASVTLSNVDNYEFSVKDFKSNFLAGNMKFFIAKIEIKKEKAKIFDVYVKFSTDAQNKVVSEFTTEEKFKELEYLEIENEIQEKLIFTYNTKLNNSKFNDANVVISGIDGASKKIDNNKIAVSDTEKTVVAKYSITINSKVFVVYVEFKSDASEAQKGKLVDEARFNAIAEKQKMEEKAAIEKIKSKLRFIYKTKTIGESFDEKEVMIEGIPEVKKKFEKQAIDKDKNVIVVHYTISVEDKEFPVFVEFKLDSDTAQTATQVDEAKFNNIANSEKK
ncbi:hypothetical protein HGG64_02355 [Mycoplasma phocoeninasale]|uniref:Lipoprotein n=2 Tax=Mycoplasma phocoeninasale TaxID=2726117 RepID=A0A858U295_9MOLU|nr:hypothetical protein [Mycoplasma phocoeninasale]QJG66532.1 hypothetical protein HGG64_02355 [Mycoplasma phocoeninasale]